MVVVASPLPARAVATPPVQPAGTARRAWIDVARGIGILLVVWGHVVRAHQQIGPGTIWGAEDRWLYGFHMPLFFMLAGLFLWRSIGRGRGAYLRGRWPAIIWPYILWSLLSIVVGLVIAPYVNNPPRYSWLITFLVEPTYQYWFLYALLICQLVVVAMWPSRAALAVAAIVGYGIICWFGGGGIIGRSFLSLPYVASGVLLADYLMRIASSSWAATALMLSSAAGYVALGNAGVPLEPGNLAGLLAGFLGGAATIGAAMLISGSAIAPPLRLLGEASLAIYVAHVFSAAGIRIALRLVGIAPASALSMAAAMVAGVVCPLLFWQALRKRGWLHLAALGEDPPRVSPTFIASPAAAH